jgi:hypothetical protein
MDVSEQFATERPRVGLELSFSHKWMEQVLKARGLPSPGLESLQRFLQQSDSSTQQALYASLLRHERGTEQAQDTDLLLATLAHARALPRTKTDPSIGIAEPPSTSTKPQAPEPQRVATPREDMAHRPPTPAKGYAATKHLRPKHHVYGSKAALTIEVDTLRGGPDNTPAMQTLILEGAVATGAKTYDWSHKIAFQFMRRELPLLACALLGMLDYDLELGNHGQDANKFVSIADQGDKLFVRMRHGAQSVAVPVSPPDVYAWLSLLMQVLHANSPMMGEAIQYAALQRTAAMANQQSKTTGKV